MRSYRCNYVDAGGDGSFGFTAANDKSAVLAALNWLIGCRGERPNVISVRRLVSTGLGGDVASQEELWTVENVEAVAPLRRKVKKKEREVVAWSKEGF